MVDEDTPMQPHPMTPEQQFIASLQERIAALESHLSQTVPPVVAPISKFRTIKHNKPPEFDGKDKHFCTTFLSHVELYMRINRSEFNTDEDKILFATSYLRGPAYSWIEPHLTKPKDSLMTNWETFKDTLISTLGDPDRERTLTRQLQSLRQNKSCASYATEFFKLSTFLLWNNEALIAQFYSGLKPEIKDALAIQDRTFDTVEDLSAACIRLDNRLYERRTDDKKDNDRKTSAPFRSNLPPTQTAPRPSPRNTSSDPVPMDIDATSNKKYKPLTPQEKDRRRKNNLCMYCGEQGHMVNTCPIRTPRRANATSNSTTTPVATFSVSGNSQNQA